METNHRGRKPFFYTKKRLQLLTATVFLSVALGSSLFSSPATAVAPGYLREKTVPATPQSRTITTPSGSTLPPKETRLTCTTDRQYLEPANMDLSVAQDGLTTVIDAPYYYNVVASDLPELRSKINDCSLRRSVAGDYHAITARRITWYYGFAHNGQACRLSEVRVGLHLSLLMPNFVPTEKADTTTKSSWNKYIENLSTHELGHIDRAKNHSQALVNQLNGLTGPDCTKLRITANKVVQAAINTLDADDSAYDAVTNHGATQGTLL